MALSYLQDAQIDAGLLNGQPRDMKQEANTQPHSSNNAAQALFPFNTAGSSAGLSLLTPQEIFASHTAALVAANFNSRIPAISLRATLSSNPDIYRHELFRNWPSAVITAGAIPEVLRASASEPHSQVHMRSTARRNSNAASNNNNSHTNNNNMVIKERTSASKKSHPVKRRNVKSTADSAKTSCRDTATQGNTAPSLLSLPAIPQAHIPLPAAAIRQPAQAVSETTKDTTKDKNFICKICARSFGYKHVLQNHERTHTGEKPFQCSECHKRFTRDHHLKTHMRLHTGEKPYHCNFCERQFVQVANLRRHLRVHTGERPYTCEICHTRFSDSNQLKSHLLIHKNEKPFVCDNCQMKFRRRHHLAHHKCGSSSMAHTDDRQDSTPAVSEEDDVEHEVDVETDGSEKSGSAEKKVKKRNDSSPSGLSNQCISQASNEASSSRLSNEAPNLSPNGAENLAALNFPANPVDLPEQTEPEDLSMSTGKS